MLDVEEYPPKKCDECDEEKPLVPYKIPFNDMRYFCNECINTIENGK